MLLEALAAEIVEGTNWKSDNDESFIYLDTPMGMYSLVILYPLPHPHGTMQDTDSMAVEIFKYIDEELVSQGLSIAISASDGYTRLAANIRSIITGTTPPNKWHTVKRIGLVEETGYLLVPGREYIDADALDGSLVFASHEILGDWEEDFHSELT